MTTNLPTPQSHIQLNDITIGNDQPFVLFGGMNVLESKDLAFEIAESYIEQLENAGMKISGYSAKQHLVESVEIANHPWYVAVQFHPEFTSQPRGGHPLFNSFVAAAKQTKK